MKYLIANIVVEYNPRFEYLANLMEPFRCGEEETTDILVRFDEAAFGRMQERMRSGVTADQTEELYVASEFNRRAIRYQTMLVHSSALIVDGRAYLFSADSGVGKSTHTRLWLKAFGDRVHIMNDDKPVIRLSEDKTVVYGTPFDGGSGIALNEAYPLGAIVFIERGEENAVRIPPDDEIIQRLYFQTAHMVSEKTTIRMLDNFAKLIERTKFFVLTCNMDISAAHFAYHSIIEK